MTLQQLNQLINDCELSAVENFDRGAVIDALKAYAQLRIDATPPTEPATGRSDNEMIFRRLLFGSHPCQGKYGDDGELQCNRYPHIDFKRDSAEEIQRKCHEHNILRWQDANAVPATNAPTLDLPAAPVSPATKDGQP